MTNKLLSNTALLAVLATAALAPIALAEQPAPNPDKPLTLSDAVAIALANHGNVISTEYGVRAAETRIRQARTGTRPNVQGQIGYQLFGDTSRVSTPGGDFDTDIGSSNGPQPRVSLGYTLFDGGLTREQVRQARANYAAARAGLGSVRSSLAYVVASDFLGQLRAEKLLDLRKEQEKLASEQLASVQARITEGAAAEADAALPLAELRNRQVDTVQAENDLSIAASSLRNSMGLRNGPPLEVVEPVPSNQNVDDLNALVDEALRNRPEVVQAAERVTAARSSVSQSRIARLPRVDTDVSYVLTPTGASRRDEWIAGATISMPIFDSGLTKAREQEARASLGAAEADYEQVRKDTQLEVDQARANLISARERITASDEALRAARVSLEQTTERYRLGAAGSSVVALITAQVQYAEAANNAINAAFDLRLAEAQLQQALGVPR